MDFVIRLANTEVAAQYPLEISTTARWYPLTESPTGPVWGCRIDLPALPADQIIVPSYAQNAPSPYTHCFVLHNKGTAYALDMVPAAAVPPPASQASVAAPPAQPQRGAEVDISCHIDCWHSHAPLEAGWIELQVQTEQTPSQYLLCVSSRPLAINADLNGISDIHVDIPANLSQMQAEANIRSRICSPTALAMALSAFKGDIDWPATVTACYDPKTQAYGAWPLAVRWATAQGVFAAVEVLRDAKDVMTILRHGSPLVCSIRFAKDALPGAPLAQTGGHLVVLYGFEDNCVLIKDPAAPDADSVQRRYSLDAFTQAWLGWRGAAYIFASAAPNV